MMQQINLYKQRSSMTLPLVIALSAIGVAFGLLLIWVVVNEIRIYSRDSQREEALALTRDLQKKATDKRVALGLPDPEIQRKEIADLRAKINANKELLAQLDGGDIGTRRGHSRVLEAIALTNEQGLWLTTLDITKSGQSLSLSGRAFDGDSVMRYSRRLNETLKNRSVEFRFSGVEMSKGPLLSGSGRDGSTARNVDGVRFTLN